MGYSLPVSTIGLFAYVWFYFLIFCKNMFYKNIEAENDEILRIF